MTTFLLTTVLAAAAFAQTPSMKISMISLGVKDPVRSAKFYSELLGLQIMGKPSEVTLVKAGDIMLVLNQPLWKSAGDAVVGAVEIIFPAESVEASYRDLKARGANFVAVPHEVTAGMWAATFTDPDGHKLTLLGGR